VFTTNVDGDSVSDVPLDREVMLDGVRVHYFASSFPRLYVSGSMKKAFSTIESFDVVHNHSVFLWPTAASAREAKRRNVPYVISPRGMLVRDLIRRKSRLVKSAWIRLIERHNFANAAAIHFTSERERDDAKEIGIPIPRSFIVPNGIDLLARPDVPRDANTVVYLGRINWKKQLDRLIEATPRDVRLIIAGNDEENLTPKLRELARGRDVEFPGPIYGDAKWELLARASVVVLPSLSENFGNVVVEAMMMSTPVIVSPEVGVASDVAAAHAGIVTHDFAAAIANVLRDPGDYGRNGRALVEAKFNWDSVAAAMEHEYQCSIA
jgi:glycosyltransferase involved in cell wall biosynthesis